MKNNSETKPADTSGKPQYLFTADDLIRVAETVFPVTLEQWGDNEAAAKHAFRAAEAFIAVAAEYKEPAQ